MVFWTTFFNKENLRVGWSLFWRCWLVNILFGGFDKALESQMKGPNPLPPLAEIILNFVFFVFGVVILSRVLDKTAKKLAKERYSLTITKHVGFRILILFIFVTFGFMALIILIGVLIEPLMALVFGTTFARAVMLLVKSAETARKATNMRITKRKLPAFLIFSPMCASSCPQNYVYMVSL